jgi:replication factor C small subunit
VSRLTPLDQSEHPNVLAVGVDGLVLGDGASVDENRHLVDAVADRTNEIGVRRLRREFDPSGALADDVDGDVHIRPSTPRRKAASTAGRLGEFMRRRPPRSLMSESAPDSDTSTGREIWIEKYRPQTLEDVYGQEDTIRRLQSYVDRDDLPHLLFAGPAGVGKTTAATAIARELYGDDWRGNFLELNASDERGIDVVRDRIKNFARSQMTRKYDYRLIFLDEADSLTSDAQSALRRTMEQFSDTTRFILSCNYSSKIIDPIQSRCAVFRFAPLSDHAVRQQIEDIAAAEGIETTDGGVDALVYYADGDMRRAINSLQAAATTGEVVDEENVYTVTSTARPEEIREMVAAAVDGDFPAARARLATLLDDVGMAGGDVIDQLHRSVWEFDLGEREAARLMDRIGEADYRIAEGANEQVQLEALLASLALDD